MEDVKPLTGWCRRRIRRSGSILVLGDDDRPGAASPGLTAHLSGRLQGVWREPHGGWQWLEVYALALDRTLPHVVHSAVPAGAE